MSFKNYIFVLLFRLFSFGIGNDVSTVRVEMLAEAGKGQAEFIKDSSDLMSIVSITPYLTVLINFGQHTSQC